MRIVGLRIVLCVASLFSCGSGDAETPYDPSEAPTPTLLSCAGIDDLGCYLSVDTKGEIDYCEVPEPSLVTVSQGGLLTTLYYTQSGLLQVGLRHPGGDIKLDLGCGEFTFGTPHASEGTTAWVVMDEALSGLGCFDSTAFSCAKPGTTALLHIEIVGSARLFTFDYRSTRADGTPIAVRFTNIL